MLLIEHIHVGYGKAVALRDVSLKLDRGEMVTLLGANGAGKSTLLKAISGIIPPSRGRIIFNGEEIQKLPPTRSFSGASCMFRKAAPFSRI